MAGEFEDFPAGLGVPDTRRVIPTAGGQALAVPAESHAADWGVVTGHSHYFLTSSNVPDSGARVGATRGD
jgi:hypothetical protein